MFDPATNAPTATTLLADSNNNGIVCRHNNFSYAQSGAPASGGLATYPRTNVGDVYPANRTGIPVNGYPFSQTGAFTGPVTS